ncbi:hypothetical protein BN946_scf185010.g44 [Trametes cinnabarina]|uniref:Uncharacterized protein n=1 Tax=Pycnoporus cinnabarinus TaxID=5643 RepID=A0A060SSB6_PYCCI|nr:hypothetical protein BN946_scf185010.g44 [Trametes cinnabarina]
MSPLVSNPAELAASTTPRPSIDETFGAFLIGTLFAVMLYGMTIHQAYQYFRVYSHEDRWNKYLVAALTVLETFHVITCAHACYYYFVRNFDNWEALTAGVWSMNILTALSGVIIILSQSFFARRAYLSELATDHVGVTVQSNDIAVSASYRPVVIIAIHATYLRPFSEVHGQSWVLTPLRVTSKIITNNCTPNQWLISAGAAMAVVADGMLTCILVTVLRKNMTGMKRMDTIVEMIILYSVSTGR